MKRKKKKILVSLMCPYVMEYENETRRQFLKKEWQCDIVALRPSKK